MNRFRKLSNWIWLPVVALVVGCLAWGLELLSNHESDPAASAKAHGSEQGQGSERGPHDAKVHVTVVRPQKGTLERLSTQPGSIQSYESIRLFAKVAGFLKKQNVDIGDRVKKGDVLAVVDVPELETQSKRDIAAVKQARARVHQMDSRVLSAEADLDAAKAAVTRAEASYKSAGAWVRFRTLQNQRMKDLFTSRSIEERLVEESKEHLEASIETELSERENVAANKAKVVAAQAKIEQTRADVEEAKADVEVAEADLEKVQVQLGFATIVAPFDGVVTTRRFFPGDFIRSANEGGNEPLLTVERTDLLRVVIQVPDRDVPFVDPGDVAYVRIDALPDRKLSAKVSRIASIEDPQTRLMRVEVDLPNPTGKIVPGMYGQVTIVLDQAKDLLSIPSSCITARQEEGKAAVYVVRNGRAQRVPVRLGIDNGVRVAVLEGLTPTDEVVLQPGSISDNAEVTSTLAG